MSCPTKCYWAPTPMSSLTVSLFSENLIPSTQLFYEIAFYWTKCRYCWIMEYLICEFKERTFQRPHALIIPDTYPTVSDTRTEGKDTVGYIRQWQVHTIDIRSQVNAGNMIQSAIVQENKLRNCGRKFDSTTTEAQFTTNYWTVGPYEANGSTSKDHFLAYA